MAYTCDGLTANVHFVIRFIDSLMFIITCNAGTKQRGGKKWKTEYRNAAFRSHHSMEIEESKATAKSWSMRSQS
jgi:hypothetical protein